jgi:hypothetical protein
MGNIVQEREEKADSKNISETFSSELEELTLSDVSDCVLDNLSDPSEIK